VDLLTNEGIEAIRPSRIDNTAQSHMSLKKGRRCWLSMWPRSNGVYVYLPGGKDVAEDAPSDFFNLVREKLEAAGLEAPSRTYEYDGDANPIALAIPLEKATHSLIGELLAQAYALA
jgi:hypothetical protein